MFVIFIKQLNKLALVDFQKSNYFFLNILSPDKVYVVENRITKKKFAVKAFLKTKMNEREYGKQALVNEINMLRLINHGNVIKLEEVFESTNSFYLITTLAKGYNLA